MTLRESPSEAGAVAEDYDLRIRVQRAVNGRSLTREQVAAVWREYEHLRDSDPDRMVTVDAFLERARNGDSALHQLVEWDDRVAAEKFRRVQARGTIRRLHEIDLDISVGERRPQRQYNVVAVTTDEHGEVHARRGYVSKREVRKSEDYTVQVHEAELRRVRAAIERVRDCGADHRFPVWRNIMEAVDAE